MNSMETLDRDWQIRLAAFAALRQLCEHRGWEVSRDEMTEGFDWAGGRIPFAVERKGIWRPRQLNDLGAALSVTTAAVKKGNKPKYDDQVGATTGYFEYRYQGTDPLAWENVSMRTAYELKRPLIYFHGLSPGRYEAIFPAYIVADDPDALTVHITPDRAELSQSEMALGGSEAPVKAYMALLVKRRLHQHRFRELVVSAYRESCAVCRLKHPELLDAAHILEDRDERGKPEIPNGLALCKIHHSAFDANILGISANHRIHIRKDILKEHDGPMLLYGLQKMDGERIHAPTAEASRPRTEYLEERFAKFAAA